MSAAIKCLVALAILFCAPGPAGSRAADSTGSERQAWLEQLHRKELPPQIAFQRTGNFGWLMRGVSSLGPSNFLWALVLFCFCCVDSKLAARIAVFLLIGLWLRELLALAIGSPRPFWIEAEVRTFGDGAARRPSFGLPSGHAMISTAFWFYLAAELKRCWAWPAAIGLVLAICASRVYLGVHFFSDVTLGVIVGAIYLWAYRAKEPLLSRSWLGLRPQNRAVLTVIFASLMLAAGLLIRMFLANDPLPEQWRAMGEAARKLEAIASYAGAVLGLGIATGMLKQWPESGGPWLLRIQRLTLAVLVLGMAELFTWFVLKQITDAAEPIRICVVVLFRGTQAWMAWGWLPKLFTRMSSSF